MISTLSEFLPCVAWPPSETDVSGLISADGYAMAVFQSDYSYRYLLFWEFEKGLLEASAGVIVWLMLNPSVATQEKLDPTLTRCASFSKKWGYSAMLIANLFAEVETQSKLLGKKRDPIGQYNDHFLRNLPAEAPIVCGWGSHPMANARARSVVDQLGDASRFRCLGANSDGSPKHPLYLKATSELKPWSPV